jgi:hypothetical protein
MSNAPFKKGQQVYLIIDWDGKGTFAVRPLEIVSCGKKQAVAADLSTGKVIEERIYSSSYDRMILISECQDPIAYCIDEATAVREAALIIQEAQLNESNHPNWVKRETVKLEFIKNNPARVEFYDTLIDEIKAKYA